MDQRRFEQTFHEIVRKLNEFAGERKGPRDPQTAPVTGERKDDPRAERARQRSKGC